MNVEITDNSGLAREEFQSACIRALEKCGLTAEGYAKLLCPVDTGNLRNSITHQMDEGEPAAIIGSAVEYAAYVELGTSRQRAQPYVKPAVADHVSTYKTIIQDELKG